MFFNLFLPGFPFVFVVPFFPKLQQILPSIYQNRLALPAPTSLSGGWNTETVSERKALRWLGFGSSCTSPPHKPSALSILGNPTDLSALKGCETCADFGFLHKFFPTIPYPFVIHLHAAPMLSLVAGSAANRPTRLHTGIPDQAHSSFQGVQFLGLKAVLGSRLPDLYFQRLIHY